MINASRINCTGPKGANEDQMAVSGSGHVARSQKRDHDASQEVGPVTSSQLSQ